MHPLAAPLLKDKTHGERIQNGCEPLIAIVMLPESPWRTPAAGTCAAVPSACWVASSGTIVANPSLRRGAGTEPLDTFSCHLSVQGTKTMC